MALSKWRKKKKKEDTLESAGLKSDVTGMELKFQSVSQMQCTVLDVLMGGL